MGNDHREYFQFYLCSSLTQNDFPSLISSVQFVLLLNDLSSSIKPSLATVIVLFQCRFLPIYLSPWKILRNCLNIPSYQKMHMCIYVDVHTGNFPCTARCCRLLKSLIPLVEHLPSKRMALSSSPSTILKKKKNHCLEIFCFVFFGGGDTGA